MSDLIKKLAAMACHLETNDNEALIALRKMNKVCAEQKIDFAAAVITGISAITNKNAPSLIYALALKDCEIVDKDKEIEKLKTKLAKYEKPTTKQVVKPIVKKVIIPNQESSHKWTEEDNEDFIKYYNSEPRPTYEMMRQHISKRFGREMSLNSVKGKIRALKDAGRIIDK